MGPICVVLAANSEMVAMRELNNDGSVSYQWIRAIKQSEELSLLSDGVFSVR